MDKKKRSKLWVALCFMVIWILKSVWMVSAEEEISVCTVAPGQADMRIGLCEGNGFLMEAGQYAGNYAPVFYSAFWSGSALGSVLPLGHFVYCVEPEVTLLGDAQYNEGGVLGNRDVLLHLTTPRITQEGRIFQMLGQILQVCGPEIQSGPEICKTAPQATRYLAAQTLIWQLVCGDMDENFNVLSSQWAEAYDLRSMPYWNTAPAGGRSVKAWQETWLQELKRMQQLPSFCSQDQAVYEMTGDTLVLTDTAQSLDDMQFIASDSSVTLTVKENTLIISNPQQVDFTVNVRNVLRDGIKEPAPILTVNQSTGAKRQTTVTASETPLTMPLEASFKIKALVISLEVSKQELTGSHEVPGAKLQILDENGQVIEEWISSDQPHYIEKLPIGTYILREILPAAGYVTAEDILFEVKDTAELQKVEMKDDITKLQISKKDLTTGEELPGAALQILDETGKVIEEWVSGAEPHYIERLPIGVYTLRETLPAKGYVTAQDVIFKIEDTAALQKVEMKDDVTKLEISKKELESGEPLSGAALQIVDQKGSVIKEWISGDRPQYIESLPVGSYTLQEKEAPKGYQKAADISFEIADIPQIQRVEMSDQKKKPSPQTGDEAVWQLYIGMLGLAGMGLGFLMRKRSLRQR
jgi:LPXTG-motif cell wall-anchored protein